MPTLYWCPHHVLKATGAPVYISRNSQATLGCNQNKMLAVPEYFFLGLDPKLLMLESRLSFFLACCHPYDDHDRTAAY